MWIVMMIVNNMKIWRTRNQKLGPIFVQKKMDFDKTYFDILISVTFNPPSSVESNHKKWFFLVFQVKNPHFDS